MSFRGAGIAQREFDFVEVEDSRHVSRVQLQDSDFSRGAGGAGRNDLALSIERSAADNLDQKEKVNKFREQLANRRKAAASSAVKGKKREENEEMARLNELILAMDTPVVDQNRVRALQEKEVLQNLLCC